MLRNANDAEDVVQEIFVDIWKNAERFDPSQSSETTFVAMIARRRIIDRIRYSARRISPDSIEDVLAEPASRGDKRCRLRSKRTKPQRCSTSFVPNNVRCSSFRSFTGYRIRRSLTLPGCRSGRSKLTPVAGSSKPGNFWDWAR
jgi:hypothetical protein